MRLIDADELPEVNTIERIDGEREVFVNSWIPAAAIWKAPTIEAIPIEWIKHWCIKNYPTYPRIITEELLKKTETWRMIEDWGKENGLLCD